MNSSICRTKGESLALRYRETALRPNRSDGYKDTSARDVNAIFHHFATCNQYYILIISHFFRQTITFTHIFRHRIQFTFNCITPPISL